jgi:cytochrome c-type biogenesis protein CcmE
MGGLFASQRSRLVALLLVATVAVSVFVVVSAGASLSYYVTPAEYEEQSTGDDTRWRVAGRVVGDSIVEVDGRRISFTILGYEGTTVEVAYDGGYPSLFGPNTLVIVEGVSGPGGGIDASSVIVKHENEFVTDAEDTQAFAPASE